MDSKNNLRSCLKNVLILLLKPSEKLLKLQDIGNTNLPQFSRKEWPLRLTENCLGLSKSKDQHLNKNE